LQENGYKELPITSAHTLAVADLSFIHKDPFDRILIAQAKAEGITFLTSDNTVSEYGGAIILV
jgi:PIN domain nuclease of toxin-antitoxin system